jgi:hypothetical protein
MVLSNRGLSGFSLQGGGGLGCRSVDEREYDLWDTAEMAQQIGAATLRLPQEADEGDPALSLDGLARIEIPLCPQRFPEEAPEALPRQCHQ